ncbi:olfactory receptor 2A7-like [Lithobates pipiens]
MFLTTSEDFTSFLTSQLKGAYRYANLPTTAVVPTYIGLSAVGKYLKITKGFFQDMTNISYVFLLGFPNIHCYSILLFAFLLVVYCFTICGNFIIIILVSISKNLHLPMYFFITQVSLLDILMSCDIVPNLLYIVLNEGGTMHLVACISQFYVFANSESTECLILTIMSYDRFVAVCNPLRYNSIINKNFCLVSVLAAWILSFLMVGMNAATTFKLEFCGSDIVDHFFCDFTPILDISCSDVSVLKSQTILICIIVIICPFILITISYFCIISAILKIQSNAGRQKAFSTCSSHLTVVCIFFGTLFFVYMVPTKGDLLATSKILSLLYTVVIPLLNPFIYSLRNQDFKKAFDVLKHNAQETIYT